MTTTGQHPARIRTFHPRRGRMTERHHDALRRLTPLFGVAELDDHPDRFDAAAPTPGGWDPAAAFGRTAPLVLEIGFGMGDATIAMARADPERDYLAVDVHTPGIANLLSMIELDGLTNLRVVRGDGLDLARLHLPERSLDAVHAFFPDPWPKARHHKRRLITPSNVALLTSRLRRGGILHTATDWHDYAQSMLETLTGEPDLVNTCGGFAERPAVRPLTKFEQRGLVAGRTIYDLVFRRR